MDGKAFGDAIAGAFIGAVIMTAIVTALVVGTGTFFVTRYFTPTVEQVQQEERRQEVIDSLTDEQREVLGLAN